MLLLDVNVLVYAHREELPQHPAMLSWLERMLEDGSTFGVPQLVLCGFVRTVTQRPFSPLTPIQKAFDFCRRIMQAPGFLDIMPGEGHWELFETLCHRCNIRGADTTDAYLAALAIERAAIWVTCDKDFAQYPGLTWFNPLLNQTVTNAR